jgi:capsular polysaccharide export protein
MRFSRSFFLPIIVRIFWFLKKAKPNYNYDFEKTLIYHKAILGNKHTNKLIKIIKMYLSYYSYLLDSKKIDFIICSGDSRLFVETLIYCAKLRNIPVFYFEQGPFRTTMFDLNGVNANSSIRNQTVKSTLKGDFEQLIEFINAKKNKEKIKFTLLYKLQKFFDYIFQFTFIGKFLFIELFLEVKRKNKKNIIRTYPKYSKTNILLILQVPTDIQLFKHSPLISNFIQMIQLTKKFLPLEYKLIVKEHPLYKGNYSTDLYDYIIENDILLLDDMSLKSALSLVDTVIVNNSISGLESILSLKKTIVLGNTYYDKNGVVLKVNSIKEYKNILSNLQNYSVNKEEMKKFCINLFNNYLFDGHFLDKDLSFIHSISEFIRNHLNENYKNY